jgi:hypothetical protein
MKIDVETFLKERESNFGEVFECACWMAKFAYLSDIFTILNELTSLCKGGYATYLSGITKSLEETY